MYLTTALVSALTVLMPVLAQTSYHPPGGNGIIAVSLSGKTQSDGCLDVNGLWTTAPTKCQVYSADGTGDISGPNGKCLVDNQSLLHCVNAGNTTAWLGEFIKGNTSATYLLANYGSTTLPTGGPTWFASQNNTSPSQSSVLLLGEQPNFPTTPVYLSWIPHA